MPENALEACRKEYLALASDLQHDRKTAVDWRDEVICPWCGMVHEHGTGSASEARVKCDLCGREFVYYSRQQFRTARLY